MTDAQLWRLIMKDQDIPDLPLSSIAPSTVNCRGGANQRTLKLAIMLNTTQTTAEWRGSVQNYEKPSMQHPSMQQPLKMRPIWRAITENDLIPLEDSPVIPIPPKPPDPQEVVTLYGELATTKTDDDKSEASSAVQLLEATATSIPRPVSMNDTSCGLIMLKQATTCQSKPQDHHSKATLLAIRAHTVHTTSMTA